MLPERLKEKVEDGSYRALVWGGLLSGQTLLRLLLADGGSDPDRSRDLNSLPIHAML